MDNLSMLPLLRRAERFPLSVGEQFGKWTVIGSSVLMRKGGKMRPHYPCRCECGREQLVIAAPLRNGLSRQCSECRMDSHGEIVSRHGQYKTKLYGVWVGMKGRCATPTHADYANYGARGIMVCEEWQNFEPFRDWAIGAGYKEGLTIERNDVNGPYAPENCRWVTQKRQMQNTRSTVFLTAFGETKSLSDWAEDSRCASNYRTMSTRYFRYKWTDHEAIITTANVRGQRLHR